MRGKMLAMAAFCAAGTFGEAIVAPSFCPATNRVDSGVMVQDDSIFVSSESCVYKTGAGKWEIPWNYLAQAWPANFGVLEGSLGFFATRPFIAGPVLPDDIAEKALIWVDADDANDDHFSIVESNETAWVDVWYDVRETDVHAPSYARAVAAFDFTNCAPAWVRYNDEFASVYFGGRGSGRLMDWILPSGSRYNATGVKSFFAVFGVVDSYGAVCGSRTDTLATFLVPGAASAEKSVTGSFAYWNEETLRPCMSNGRTYIDGERIDGFKGNVRTGFHLLEAMAKYPSQGKAQCFFGVKPGSSIMGTGGDYLCEAIVFTNVLTEAERLDVERYLMAKWFPDKRGTTIVTLGTGAELALDVEETVVDRPDMWIKGTGTVRKTGGGEFQYENRNADIFGGELAIDGGSARLFAPMALDVAAGDRLTVTNSIDGPLAMRTTDVGADELVKDGGDIAKIHDVPAGVKKLKVESGTLELEPAVTNGTYVATDAYEVYIRNPGFEEIEGELTSGCYTDIPTSGDYCGWTRNNSGGIYIYDWHAWTGTGIDTVTRSAMDLKNPPPEGRCALFLPNQWGQVKRAYTEVVIPEDGLYEVSFQLSGRENDSYQHGHLRVLLMDSANAVKTEFGRVTHSYTEGFKPVAMRGYATAGTQRLAFQTTSSPKGFFVIDDVHLRRIPEPQPESWPVPNGDFEMATIPYASAGHAFSETNTVDGWTWTQAPGWTKGTLPTIGLVTLATGSGNLSGTVGIGNLYNDSREPAADSVQLLFKASGTSATATFTPPAGTWLVQADLGKWYAYNGTLDATAVIGGSTYRLGRIDIRENAMTTFQWPTNFTVAADEEVSLVFSFATTVGSTGVNMDNVKLVKAYTGNLIKDGDCEKGLQYTQWKTMLTGEVDKGSVTVFSISSAPSEIGADAVDGRTFYELGNLGGIKQAVNFPMPGRYRLSFYSHSRLGSTRTGGYGPGDVRAWVLSDGVTNVIGHCHSTQTNWTERVFDFDVPSAGVRTVAIQGDTLYDSYSSCVDHITLRHLGDCAKAEDLVLPDDLQVSVSAGARLHLGYPGTNKVARVRLDGRSTPGYVSAATHPEYISGPGVLFSNPVGVAISIR